jgi:hypothetical protein
MSVVDAVDGSSTGIAMCQISATDFETPVSAYGTKPKFRGATF